MFIHAKSQDQAESQHPGAAIYVRVRGGYMAFDWAADYVQWRKSYKG